MSVDKFKFAGPSIQVAEIDESRIEQPVSAVGPVIIGRTEKGPAMVPVTVSTAAELERVFGSPYNGKTDATDVWRDGNHLAPTYATYAAKAFLQNSAPVTVIRTLGMQDPTVSSISAKAGWNIANSITSSATAQGLFLFNSGTGDLSGELVAVFYGMTTANQNSTGGPECMFLSGAAGSLLKNTLVFYSGTNPTVRILGTDALDRTKGLLSFDKTSPIFIRRALNTDPTKTNAGKDSILSKNTNECYFLAESFEDTAQKYITSSNGYFAAMITLATSSYSANFSHLPAESGIIVAQHIFNSSSFEKDSSTGKYPVKELFKFVTLSGGEWEQANIKVGIENIKVSSFPLTDPYGTFDVVIRNIYTDEILESFRGLNLNPSSPSYISKAIGDMYREWDYSGGRYKEIGTYPNNSSRVRVEILADIIEPELLPFGFYGPFVPSKQSVKTAGDFTNSTVTISDSNITGISASFPIIDILGKNTKSLSRTSWGLKVDSAKQELIEKLRLNAVTKSKTKGQPSVFMSLDDIGSTTTASYAKWENGLRKSGISYSSSGSSPTYTNTLKYVNSFQVPLFGGFDGVNIFEREPIVNNVVLKEGNAKTNYAYNTLEVALRSISDKEVVETDIVTIPGLTNRNLVQTMIDVCESRGDALALVDLESDYVPEHENVTAKASERLPVVESAKTFMKNALYDTTFAAAYYPAVYEAVENVFLPATVAALGVIGGTQANAALWFAPAGFVRGGITKSTAGLSVTRAAQHLTSADRDDLYNLNVNPLAMFPNEGVVVFGQKTLQAVPSALSRVNVRRLLNHVKRNVEIAARGVLFEPNIEATWNDFHSKVNPFLTSIKSNFGLEDFRILLDSKTTTADLVDRNIMYAKILLKPTKAIEYIAVDFVITNSGAVFSE